MKRFYAKLNYFSNAEKVLWTASVCLIVGAYIAFGSRSPLNLAASLIGVTSLLFAAKGNKPMTARGISYYLCFMLSCAITWVYHIHTLRRDAQ